MGIGEEVREAITGALDQREQVEQGVKEQRQSGDFQQRMAAFAQLENYRRQLEEALKLCKAERDRLAGPLMEEMAENGVQNMRVNGLNVHTRTDFYCNKKGGVPPEQLCEALREAGMGDLVKEGYSAGSLKSIIKEMLEEGQDVPESLAELVQFGEVQRLVSNK